jgi:hypothetical protein
VKFIELILCPLLFAATLAHAQTPLSLVVDGNIAHINDPAQHAYRFNEAELLALPAATITTTTNWTPKQSFSGPKLSAVLARVGAKGMQLSVCAIDDYCQDIPVSDIDKYGVILAATQDGKRLEVRNFGPLWVMYPRDGYPQELNTATYVSRFIWQVNKITVK